MKFLMIRHGVPDFSIYYDKQLISAKRGFSPLSRKEIEGIYGLGYKLKKYDPDIIISSPYTRALQTAANLRLNLPVLVEYDLREWEFDLNGDQHVSYEEISSRVDILKNNQTEHHDNIEDMTAVRERVLGALQKYKQYNVVILVCHGVVIKSLTNKEKVNYLDIVEFELND